MPGRDDDLVVVAVHAQRLAGGTAEGGGGGAGSQRGGRRRRVVVLIPIRRQAGAGGKGGAEAIGQIGVRRVEGVIGEEQRIEIADAVVALSAQPTHFGGVAAIQLCLPEAFPFAVKDGVLLRQYDHAASVRAEAGIQRGQVAAVAVGPVKRPVAGCAIQPVQLLGVGVEGQIADESAFGGGVDGLGIAAVGVGAVDDELPLLAVQPHPVEQAADGVEGEAFLPVDDGHDGLHVAAIGVGAANAIVDHRHHFGPIDPAGGGIYGDAERAILRRHIAGIGITDDGVACPVEIDPHHIGGVVDDEGVAAFVVNGEDGAAGAAVVEEDRFGIGVADERHADQVVGFAVVNVGDAGQRGDGGRGGDRRAGGAVVAGVGVGDEAGDDGRCLQLGHDGGADGEGDGGFLQIEGGETAVITGHNQADGRTTAIRADVSCAGGQVEGHDGTVGGEAAVVADGYVVAGAVAVEHDQRGRGQRHGEVGLGLHSLRRLPDGQGGEVAAEAFLDADGRRCVVVEIAEHAKFCAGFAAHNLRTEGDVNGRACGRRIQLRQRRSADAGVVAAEFEGGDDGGCAAERLLVNGGTRPAGVEG